MVKAFILKYLNKYEQVRARALELPYRFSFLILYKILTIPNHFGHNEILQFKIVLYLRHKACWISALWSYVEIPVVVNIVFLYKYIQSRNFFISFSYVHTVVDRVKK